MGILACGDVFVAEEAPWLQGPAVDLWLPEVLGSNSGTNFVEGVFKTPRRARAHSVAFNEAISSLCNGHPWMPEAIRKHCSCGGNAFHGCPPDSVHKHILSHYKNGYKGAFNIKKE